MNTLSLALYNEGSTDNRFLPPIIAKTARSILDNHQQNHVGVSEIRIIEVRRKKRPESILQAALAASGYHALIVHADADHPQAYKARNERFEPGLQLVQQTNGDLCKNLLPIIPIQAIEAWMLADYQSLLMVIGTEMHPREFGIPEKAYQVESIAKPKRKLEEAMRKAYASRTKRRRKTDIDFLYEPMGERISLERLSQVPSYQQFIEDLTQTLENIELIPRIHRM